MTTDEFTKAVREALGLLVVETVMNKRPSAPMSKYIAPDLASIQASTVKLLLELIGPDEQTVPGGMYGVDYKNAFRQELRTKIKDLTNE